MPDIDPRQLDVLMRAAAFDHVRRLQKQQSHITSSDLGRGFEFESERVPLVNPRGIFKPREMQYLLSIRTVFPPPGGMVRYDDQRDTHRRIIESDETVQYDFMRRTELQAADNREPAENLWLLDACEHKIPIIYFLGIAPRRYQAVLPTFIIGWDACARMANIVFGVDREQTRPDRRPASYKDIADFPAEPRERGHALQLQKRRLHQGSFREAILRAYGGRCAISGISEPSLLDAAHIIPDRDERFGQPVVQNGLLLSKTLHAAFDANLIGIDADYRLHVSRRLLNRLDRRLLESLNMLRGRRIHLPHRPIDRPDPNRLAMRFEQFQAAG